MSSYSTDLVISKLSNLNESQDSITSVSQWVLFHRRAANETVRTWLQCLREASSASRKLSLVYLANDVVQQSRARRKDEFPKAFAGIIAEAMEIAYRGTTPDVQNKLRRVTNVWRERVVFELPVLDKIEQKLEAIDKAKGKGGIIRPSKSTGPPIPPELNSLISLHNTLSTLVTHATQTQSSASSAYSSLLQSDHLPSPPVYLPRLTQLLKSLNDSKEATLAVVKARTELVRALETLLDRHKRELTKSEGLLSEVDEQVKGVQLTRDEVQNMMENNGDGARVRSTTPEVEPPVVEALTPPSSADMESGNVAVELGDDLAGLDNLDPEIVALLKADMGLNNNNSGDPMRDIVIGNEDVDEYAP